MNIGVITVAFNEPDFIKPCIKQFDGFNFPHLVLISNTPWRGNYQMDNTWAIAKIFLNNGEVIIDNWPDQATQFNYGLELLQQDGFDWALIVDADEFYTPESIGALVGQIRITERDAITATHMDVYWKTPSHKVTPDQYDYPVIAIKTSKRFANKRHVESSCTTAASHNGIELHHMSYVRNNEQMKKKIETFEHSHEFDTNTWYKNVWLPWTKESRNLHPTVPPNFEAALYNPAPPAILDLLDGIPH